MKTCYIAGKITGEPNYKTRFSIAETMLTTQGYHVMNPAWMPKRGFSWEQYMQIGCAMLAQCEIVCFLSGWEKSKGACIEHEMAKDAGKKILYLSGAFRIKDTFEGEADELSYVLL